MRSLLFATAAVSLLACGPAEVRVGASDGIPPVKGSSTVSLDNFTCGQPIPAGDYLVSANTLILSADNDYVGEYFNNVRTSLTATPVHVAAGANTPNINFGLALGGSISGRILSGVIAGQGLLLGDLRAPGKFFQHAAHEQQACDVNGGRQVLGAQIDKPAEDVRVASQLIERSNGRMLLTKIDQKGAGDGTILTGRSRSESCCQRVNRSLELLHQRMFQRSVAADFHEALPGTGLMCCLTAFAYC